jgi:hypothetical protein
MWGNVQSPEFEAVTKALEFEAKAVGVFGL